MPARAKIRVVLVAEQALFRAALRRLVASHRDMETVGEASNAEQSSQLIRRLEPDVAVLSSSTLHWRTLLARIAKARAECRVLVLVSSDDRALPRLAIAAGAAGFLGRSATEQDLVDAIRAASDGAAADFDAPIPARVTRRRGRPQSPRTDSLSRREWEVLELLARGHTNREVAARLGVGVKSVETYRARLAEKAGLVSRADIVTYALEVGLLAPTVASGRE